MGVVLFLYILPPFFISIAFLFCFCLYLFVSFIFNSARFDSFSFFFDFCI